MQTLVIRPPNSVEPTCENLLAHAQQGDQLAWHQLVGLYGPVVAYWIRPSRLNPDDTADVFQEVFSAVSQSLVRFQQGAGPGTFRQWLKTITRNKIHDHFRRALLRVTTTAAIGLLNGCCLNGDDSEVDEGCDDSSVAGERAALVQGAISMVRQEFREATWQSFWLTAMEDNSASEVARQLKISAVAVRKNKSRVLTRIRTVLQSVL